MIGSVGCSGNESGLLNCSYVSDSDKAVSGCDPGETAAVTCQGLLCEGQLHVYRMQVLA